MSWFCFFIVLKLSAAQFSYTTDYDDCNICIDSNCVISGSSCKYFAKTAGLLEKKYGGEEEKGGAVDGLLYDLVESAGHFNTCIPYISKYTDCSKDNICTGCQTCKCNEIGVWRCSFTQQCRPDTRVLDRESIKTVINSLKIPGDKSKRTKRFVTPINYGNSKIYNHTDRPKKLITKPLYINKNNNISTNEKRNAKVFKSNRNINETDLSFVDVLNDIIKDNSKNLTNKVNEEINDAIVLVKGNNNISTEEFVHMLNAIEELEASETSSATEAVIDLLKSGNTYDKENMNFDRERNHFDSTSRAIDNELGNVMKREVSTRGNTNIESTHNHTTHNKDLEENVLVPLSNIINSKKQEIDDLIKIKTKLLTVLKTEHNMTISRYNNKTENPDEYFSIYKLELFPSHDTFRRNDPKIMDKYVMKLKRDVYEVIRDIVGIQKLSKSKLTDNIRLLARAMQRYVHVESGLHKTNKDKIKRRHRQFASVKDYVLSILETVYNGSENNEICCVSPNAKQIVHRLVKENSDVADGIGLKYLDNNGSLLNYLEVIGTEWRDKLYDVLHSSPKDILYNMKLLHLQIMNDIFKMQNSLQMLQFAQNRRMVIIDEDNTEIREISRVHNELKLIVKNMAPILNQPEKTTPKIQNEQEKPTKKLSFLKHVKDLLKNSKIDIFKLLHKKVPKSDIIKEAAKNRLNDANTIKLSEYEKTLRTWKNNLNNIKSRSKRAVYANIKHKHHTPHTILNRLKNIIPKYLRRKVFSASKTNTMQS